MTKGERKRFLRKLIWRLFGNSIEMRGEGKDIEIERKVTVIVAAWYYSYHGVGALIRDEIEEPFKEVDTSSWERGNIIRKVVWRDMFSSH